MNGRAGLYSSCRLMRSCQQAIMGPEGILNQKNLPISGMSVRGKNHLLLFSSPMNSRNPFSFQ